ncbi:PRD domain-containing protein [Shouchella shacheensis]|uniref:PRD domain-containing protein n=1 Tax=Shouchella shacheensis TaxID=1649580 RepID=UPI00073FFC16|nr:PRD domain-containing protein [Shouchella shacheensis]
MYLIKSFNNNIALVKDASGTEWIVLGTGVGFGKEKGEAVDELAIKRKFIAETSAKTRQPFLEMVDQIPVSIFETTANMMKTAEAVIGVKLSHHLFLSLADHLNFAIQRVKDNVDDLHMDRWELQKLYSKEHQAAVKAIRVVYDELDVLLPRSEESFLTYHFVNAQGPRHQLSETMKMTEVINRIIEIIEYHYEMQLNEESANYSRLLTHLRYFVLRQLHEENLDQNELDQDMIHMIKDKYSYAYECVEKISRFLAKRYEWDLSVNEKLYLTLHIWRLIT